MYIGKEAPIKVVHGEDALTITWKPNPTYGFVAFCVYFLMAPFMGYAITYMSATAPVPQPGGPILEWLAWLYLIVAPVGCYVALTWAVDVLTIQVGLFGAGIAPRW